MKTNAQAVPKGAAFSNKIYIYSFLLSILVIFVHGENLAETNLMLEEMARNAPMLSPVGIENFFSNTLGQGAVPGFFLLSGYLFYRNLPSFWKIPKKWADRVRSLVVPYAFWNAVLYLLNVLLGRTGFSFSQLSDAIANYKFNPVFWYLFQLILLTALAPILYILLRKFWISILSLVGISLMVYFLWDIPYLNEDALFYYFLGGFLVRFRKKFFEEERWNVRDGFLLLIMLFLTGTLKRYFFGIANGNGMVLFTVWFRACLALSIWFMLPAGGLPAAAGFMKQNFFLYAIHYPLIRFGAYALRKFSISGDSALQMAFLLLSYFLLPIFLVIIADFAAKIIRKKMPRLWRVMSGGR